MDNASSPSRGGTFTLTLLVLGLTVVGASVIVPQADANRRLAFERDKLLADLTQIDRQAAVNNEFLSKVDSDPELAQRLAQRQMKYIRQGESLLPVKMPKPAIHAAAIASEVSPFSLVYVPPPPALAPYQPAGGAMGAALLDSHFRLYSLAGGLLLVAMGLIFSHEPAPRTGN